MSKTQFHVSDSGKLAPCNATKRGCPKGGKHFSEAARDRIESGLPRSSAERSAWLTMSQARRTALIKKTRASVDTIDQTVTNKFKNSIAKSKKDLDELNGIREELKGLITSDSDPSVVAKVEASLKQLEIVFDKKVEQEKALHTQARAYMEVRGKNP